MTWQRGGKRHAESPPPNRVASSPYNDNDYYYAGDSDSQQSYDSNDGSPSKSRHDNFRGSSGRNSISIEDATDFVNTLSGGINNGSYYESFVMESPPKSNGTIGSLHHRHHNHNNNNYYSDNMTPSQKHSRYNTNDYDDESPQHRLMRQRAVLSPHTRHAIEQLHDKSYDSSILSSLPNGSTRQLARWTFGIVFSLYLVLLTRSTHYLTYYSLFTRDVSNAPEFWDSKPDCYMSAMRTRGTGCQQIPSWYEEQKNEIERARSKQEARRSQRRRRTKVASSFKIEAEDWHQIVPLDEKKRDKSSAKRSKNNVRLASIDQLCGVSAKNSSLVSPESYPSRAALNKKSRVLITGVLNPVGLSLALRLKQHCGVQHIMGADAMYPNTVLNRIMAQDRIKLLNSNPVGVTATKPVILPFFGLDIKSKASSKKNGEEKKKQSLEDEMAWMRSFKPTHVVHLASYSTDVYNDALLAPEWRNTNSPYISNDYESEDQHKTKPYLYPLRSEMVSMEQILQTIAGLPAKERPQFLYASSPLKSNSPLNNLDKAFHTIKRIDELLADMYHSRNEEGLPSIGLRLPASIYGPWGHAGSTIHDILSRAVEDHSDNSKKKFSLSDTNNEGSRDLDLLFVDDAVDVIISALQYRSEGPTKVTVPSERTASIEYLSAAVESLLNDNTADELTTIKYDKVIEESPTGQSLILPKTERTQLKDGLAKSIAWHMDRLSPFGTPPTKQDLDAATHTKQIETGDEFMQRHDVKICEAGDTDCHKNNEYLPCNSECNIHQNCLPSVFDEVRDLLYSVSDGCDIVMYTQMLGYNVEDAELHAEYMDDSDLSDDEPLVCNFAFVPRESDLVSLVTSNVASEQLAKFGIEPRTSDRSGKDFRERKLDNLNGRLLYKGWILIWVKDGMRELSAPDASIMKLSPSKFFHPTVEYGLFVEENFKVSPNLEDVLFLVDQMHRRELGRRKRQRSVAVETPNGQRFKKVKYELPPEPARRAAILLAPLRYPNTDGPINSIIQQYKEGNKKLTMLHASKFMGYEVGYQPGEKESPSLRRQREFYERINTFINKNNELRSNLEPWYRFTPKHWIRSRWVLHDFTLEEARLLRCDWYQEHVQWGNDLDQMSFVKVMAMRDLKRRIVHKEPDDHVKSFIEEHPEIRHETDSHEWHPIEAQVHKLYHEPLRWDSDYFETAGGSSEAEGKDDSMGNNSLYVRIMSERVMDASRKIWTKEKRKQKKKQRTSAEG